MPQVAVDKYSGRTKPASGVDAVTLEAFGEFEASDGRVSFFYSILIAPARAIKRAYIIFILIIL